MRALVYGAIVVAFLLLAAGCDYVLGSMADQQTAINAMTSAGYTDVKVVARHNIAVSFLGCSTEDSAKFDMVATNPQGEVVTNVYVCVGWPFKGATIRYR